jgi:hypothetical protein
MSLFIRLFGIFCILYCILYSYEEGHKIQDAFSKYMKFGETLLEFSKGTLFHDVYLVAYTNIWLTLKSVDGHTIRGIS